MSNLGTPLQINTEPKRVSPKREAFLKLCLLSVPCQSAAKVLRLEGSVHLFLRKSMRVVCLCVWSWHVFHHAFNGNRKKTTIWVDLLTHSHEDLFVAVSFFFQVALSGLKERHGKNPGRLLRLFR